MSSIREALQSSRQGNVREGRELVFAIQLERRMQHANGVFDSSSRDHTRDADIGRADDVDIDAGRRKGAEHPRRVAWRTLHPRADDAHFGQLISGVDRRGTDLGRHRAGDLERALEAAARDREGHIRGAVGTA